MQIFGDIDSAGRQLLRNAGELEDKLDKRIRSRRNKAIVDVITARYEARENIKDMGREAVSGMESLMNELSQSFWDRKK